MTTFHPIYGAIEVPDSMEELKQNIQAARHMIKKEYNPVVMAYLDSCESAMDMFRRGKDEL